MDELEKIRADIQVFFSGLDFDAEKHRYSVDGLALETSVSGIVERFSEKVDFGRKALEKDMRLGLEPGTTKAEWDAHNRAACDRGTAIHLFAERWLEDRSLAPTCGEEEAVVGFWTEAVPMHWRPVLQELRMWHKEHLFAGTMDVLLWDELTGEFAIVDYKTNKDLFKNFMGKTLLPPFGDLLDSPFSKYRIQLSLYQMLFEQTGYRVSKRKLVWLTENGYKVYDAGFLEVPINPQ